MEEIIASSNTAIRAPPPPQQQQQVLDDNSQRRARPDKDQNLNCPRCNSTNTKFCYYNNYSLSQPRYFCKTCRRYWTAGGSLRNVPVGGGSRKNKGPSPSTLITPSSSPPISSLSSPSSATSTISNNLIPDLNPPHHHHHISLSSSSKIHPHPHHHGQDLNLAFPTSILQPMEMAKTTESNKVDLLPNFSSSPSSALELLRTGIASSSLNSFVPVPMSDSNAVLYPSSGFPNLQELKPSFMGFPGPTDGLGLGPGGDGSQGHGGEARLFFPFGDINKFRSHQSAATATNYSSTTVTGNEVDNHQSIKGSTQDHQHQHQHHQVAGGYWSGMLGGGAW